MEHDFTYYGADDLERLEEAEIRKQEAERKGYPIASFFLLLLIIALIGAILRGDGIISLWRPVP